MSNVKKRIAYVDIAKILGMFFIIYGHTLRNGEVTTWIYTFHVPLFFFLSGVTFHGEVLDIKTFLKKKAMALLVPFFIWALISIGVFAVMSSFIPMQSTLQSSQTNPLISMLMGYCGANSPLWFLPCLFIVEILMWIVTKLSSKMGRSVYLVSIACSSLLCLTWPLFAEKGVIWNVNNAIYLFPFSMVGYLCGNRAEKIDVTAKNIGTSAILVAGGGTVGTVLNHQISYLGGYYGNVALFYISAFATILGVCYFCRCLPNILHSTYLGANTMAVLVMHKFLVMFFLVCPGIKIYTVYTHPLFCAALSIINMGLCYLAGWVVGHNKMLSKILFGK